nr:MAG TPA: hypothetical protein [Caudoviricetes sp.]
MRLLCVFCASKKIRTLNSSFLYYISPKFNL